MGSNHFIQRFRQSLRNQKGFSSLMLVTTAVIFITYLVIETTYDTRIEYEINANDISRIKAYYAAKAAVDFSLLRIRLYNTARTKFKSQLGAAAQKLDLIWSIPIPFPLVGLSGSDQNEIKKANKESLMDASFTSSISEEGSKIDISDLNSPSEVLRNSTRTRIKNLFMGRMESEKGFSDRYNESQFDELIDNMTDFMSRKIEGVKGGDKYAKYSELNSKANFNSPPFPPNRAPRTIRELRYVAGMNEEFLQILEPAITIYGSRAINPNQATEAIIKSLDVAITDEVAKAVVARVSNEQEGGPYKTPEDFWNYLEGKGVKIDEKSKLVPLIFDEVTHFRIAATGTSGRITKSIDAIAMNFVTPAKAIRSAFEKEYQKNNPGSPTPTPTPTQATGPGGGQTNGQKPENDTKAPPTIVYWSEH